MMSRLMLLVFVDHFRPFVNCCVWSLNTQQACTEIADDAFLINTLRNVFSSVPALGSSFRQEETTQANDSQSIAAAVTSCPIDFQHLDKAYALILKQGPKYVVG